MYSALILSLLTLLMRKNDVVHLLQQVPSADNLPFRCSFQRAASYFSGFQEKKSQRNHSFILFHHKIHYKSQKPNDNMKANNNPVTEKTKRAEESVMGDPVVARALVVATAAPVVCAVVEAALPVVAAPAVVDGASVVDDEEDEVELKFMVVIKLEPSRRVKSVCCRGL